MPCACRATAGWRAGMEEMNQQITNYIRGKVLEMIVVGVATWIGFILFDLNYSLLLAVLVGFSVLIPYIGAFVVTIPVVGVALFQFGAGPEFLEPVCGVPDYSGLDGNLLVPVLFSEAVNLHPLVIILSVAIFGGLWGFWGVFAIPLATLIKAVVHAWGWPGGGRREEIVRAGKRREENGRRVSELRPGVLRQRTLAVSTSSAPHRGDCWF